MDNAFRGRIDTPSREERDFWGNFSMLSLDDREIPYNDLIEKLRNIAIEYWKDYRNKE